MKVLSIGNSFSQDATRYLHNMAKENNVDLKSVNLYIGGCSLKTHYYNILENNKNYLFEFNGESTGIFVTVKEALMSDDWDYITLQQVSDLSMDFESYFPYLSYIKDYVKKYCPKTKILIHETWAYDDNSPYIIKSKKYNNSVSMFSDIEKAYMKAKEKIKADGIILSGEVFINMYKRGIKNLHRDFHHASYGIGRYALALLFLSYFSKKDPRKIKFSSFDEKVSEEEINIAKDVVSEILRREK